jgi:hypothetical protein
MSDLKNILKEEYKKRQEVVITPDLLMNIIQEAMNSLDPSKLSLLTEVSRRRGRALRLPPLVPTEISVGQKPTTEDSSLFRQWMSKIGLAESDGSQSQIALKLKAITDFFANPEKSMEGLPVAQTLSYLMFLDQFIFVIREFNPSVAGFLWEPLMASLFGSGSTFQSRQIPTGEHDIADIIAGQENSPVSLKVLRKKGTVEGSFNDLAMHFANYGPEANMRYVVAIKSMSKGRRGNKINAVTFYEFDITHESFFDWVGHETYEERVETGKKSFVPAKLDSERYRKTNTFLARGGSKLTRSERTGMPMPDYDDQGSYLWIRTGKIDQSGMAIPSWIRIAQIPRVRKDHPLRGLWVPSADAFDSDLGLLIGGAPPVENEPLDLNAKWTANLALTAPGGVGGFTVQSKYELMPGGASNEERERIWGDEKEQAYWKQLALDDPSGFWKLVTQTKEEEVTKKGKTKMETVRYGPPGFRNREQFTIGPRYYVNRANTIGTLSVNDYTVSKSFKAGAQNIGEDMTKMFNAMAELSENIGRFFLTDCGTGAEDVEPVKCSKRDYKRKDAAGVKAVQNASELKRTVDASIGGMKESAEDPERPQAMGGSQVDYGSFTEE